jgi:DNA-binding NarL/FixJ family response regulator
MSMSSASTGASPKPLRILIADDHDLIRRGLRILLESRPGWTVCAESSTGRDAVAKAEELRPDIVILDVRMPELNGIDAGQRIVKALPGTEVLIVSADYTDHLIRRILAAGLRGYIVKSDSDRDLITAVQSLADGKAFFTPLATELMVTSLNHGGATGGASAASLRDRLTSREREIVQLICEGKSSKEISTDLGISVKTAESHRANIMQKLEIHSVTEIVRYAIRNQIAEA